MIVLNSCFEFIANSVARARLWSDYLNSQSLSLLFIPSDPFLQFHLFIYSIHSVFVVLCLTLSGVSIWNIIVGTYDFRVWYMYLLNISAFCGRK